MSTYTADQLKGAGVLLSGNITAPLPATKFLITNTTSTGSAYFTFETVRNGEGNYAATVIINGNNITAQTATSMTDSTVNFSTLGVEIGYLVTNTVSGDTATVTAITSNTELAISANIFSVALETYSITDAWPTNAKGGLNIASPPAGATLVVTDLIQSDYIFSVVVPPGGVSGFSFDPSQQVNTGTVYLRGTGGISLEIDN
tara:strand:- start:223 stop:828 length:606 start_codon:yes stop_codon:yes gene_type:complete